MDGPNMPAQAKPSVRPGPDFLDWLDEMSTPALISAEHDRYYAFCVEFGIAGSGKTKDEAISDATSLLMRYLAVSFSEGRSYRDSKKSPPWRIRIRSWYLFARTKFLRRLKPPLSRLGWLISVPTAERDTHRLAH
jgi:predicted RNase H-like HicB family nuclease